MHRSTPRKRQPRGTRPRAPRPADASAEALIEAAHLVNMLDGQDVEHLRQRRNHRHELCHLIADAINGQRQANGLPALSEADRAAIGFPDWFGPTGGDEPELQAAA